MGALIDFNSVNTLLQTNSTTGRSGIATQDPTKVSPRDTAIFGARGISTLDSMNIVVQRALDKLLQVVNDARAELGIEEGASIDTSAEATAGRILDFALGAFEQFRDHHPELGEDEARQEFAQFIGAAISQGIEEARGILEALGALDGGIENMITTIADIVAEGLEAFAAGGS